MANPVILDGKALARQVRSELGSRVDRLKAGGITPGLRILLVGEDASSQVYVRNKERAGVGCGIDAKVARLPATTGFSDIQAAVTLWNGDAGVHGIIIQLPLPSGLDEHRALALVPPDKDVDGLSPASLGALVAGCPGFMPATPLGIIELLVRNDITIAGKRVVIVGRGELVGKPLANMLLLHGRRGDATITVCHSKTQDLATACRSAEILVVAVGKPRLITADMVSPGVVVIDAGTNVVEGKLVGDVDFESVAARASAITPVPGGVGPMTVAMLLANVVSAAEKSAGSEPGAEN